MTSQTLCNADQTVIFTLKILPAGLSTELRPAYLAGPVTVVYRLVSCAVIDGVLRGYLLCPAAAKRMKGLIMTRGDILFSGGA